MNLKWRHAAVLLASVLFALSCQKKESNPTAPSEGEVPAGLARIAGAVRDAGGVALPNVALHVIYVMPTPAKQAADPLIPSTAIFYNDQQVLTTECGGGTPLQDGVLIKLFWDQNGDGPDPSDPQPPLCADPPDCANGPSLTANFTELPINGVDVQLGAGYFYATRAFTTIGELLSPSRYYGRIYCSDGNVLWTSDVIDVLGGYGEYLMTFPACTPCEGGPVVPAWQLSPSYPNPAEDSVIIRYSLLETRPVLLSLHGQSRASVDTLFYQANVSTGSHEQRVSLANLPHPPHNGLYTLRLSAISYQAEQPLLRNVTEAATLRGMDGIAVSAGDGSYTFDTAAGVTFHRYAADGTDGGSVLLNRVRVLAIKPGYAITDTTIGVGSAQNIALDLRLLAE